MKKGTQLCLNYLFLNVCRIFLHKENYVCNKAVRADFPLPLLCIKKGRKKFSSTACICFCFVNQDMLIP